MTAIERMFEARQAALEGRHEQALRELIWFHDHALEEDQALVGVRLSYALFHWVELGKAYPPARQALEDVRDRKTRALLDGEAGYDVFRDVASINEHLGDAPATHTLYVALAEGAPELARQCTSFALPAIVEAGDFRLADRLRLPPEQEIRTAAASLAADIRSIKHQPYSRAPRRWATIRGYTTLVRRHIAISTGLGDRLQARHLGKLAADLLDDPPLRAEVRAQLARAADRPQLHLYRRGWKRARRRMRDKPRNR